jgi:ribosomal protein L11 methyltransferase
VKWIEISVRCDGEAAEAVSEVFNRLNAGQADSQGGAVIEVTGYDAVGELPAPLVTVRTYVPAEPAFRDQVRKIEEALWFLGRLYPIPEPTIRELAEQDWATAWRVHYHPTRVGRRLMIVPAWEAGHVGEIARDDATAEPLLPVILDPGMAFGTGLHPSTRLCMAALERVMTPGDAVLDVGCGSGILSIAAARLDAGSVLATDIDPVAVGATRENCQRNGVDRLVEVREGTLPDPAERPEGWSVIVVNILAEVIVQLLKDGLHRLLAADGRLVLSGIIEPRAEDVVVALERRGLHLVERSQEGDWVGLVAAIL